MREETLVEELDLLRVAVRDYLAAEEALRVHPENRRLENRVYRTRARLKELVALDKECIMSEEIRFSGVTLPTNGLNKCCVEGCENDSCTAVSFEGNSQFNVCGWHLKEKTESGEWVPYTKSES